MAAQELRHRAVTPVVPPVVTPVVRQAWGPVMDVNGRRVALAGVNGRERKALGQVLFRVKVLDHF